RLAHARTDFQRFNRPDWRVLALKTLLQEAIVVLTYFIVRPLPGIPETLWTLLAKVIVVLPTVAALWIAFDRVERKPNLVGHYSDRNLTDRERHLFPVLRVKRRLAAVQRLLSDFRGADPGWAGDNGSAKSVARDVVEMVQKPSPMPALLPELGQFPGLEEQARHVQRLWRERHQVHRHAVALVVLWLVAGRSAVRGASTRLDGQSLRQLTFHLALLGAFGMRKNLSAIGLKPRLHAALRSEAEEYLIAELQRRLELRIAYLQAYLKLLHDWRSLLRDARYSPDDRARADAAIRRVIAMLEREHVLKVDDRGAIAARMLLRERRESLDDALTAEEGALEAPAGSRTRTDDQIRDRIATIQRLLATLALIDGWVALHDEIDLHRAERKYWREQLAEAVERPARVPVNSLLGVLLILVGHAGPVTAAQLANLHPEVPGEWQRLLNRLRSAKVITGDPDAGYRS
ncbi:MAG: hypothetical protein ACRD0H_07905, partial [Actinomycetes bacterium]